MDIRFLVTFFQIVYLSMAIHKAEFKREVCVMQPNKCYSLWSMGEPVSKWQALQHCYAQNETLASITSVFAQEQLIRRLNSSSAWTGLNIIPSARRQWRWLHANGWYNNIIPDALIQDLRNGSCLLINRIGLLSAGCSTSGVNVICQYDSLDGRTDCDLGFKWVEQRWICISSKKMSWVDAAKLCAKQKGNMLIIDSDPVLQKVKDMLKNQSLHFWTGGTRVYTEWDDKDESTNSFSLLWDNSFPNNPNLDEATRGELICTALSSTGLVYKRCGDTLSSVICNRPNPNSSLVEIEAPLNKNETNTADLFNQTISRNTAGEQGKGKKYEEIILCAYVLAAVFGVGLIILIIVFIKRRKNRHSMYDQMTRQGSTHRNGSISKQPSSGNNTLIRQKSNPAEEWGKVLKENGEMQPMLSSTTSAQIEIIHNVPLDPRSSIDKPLTIPKETEFIVLQRNKSIDSHDSCSSNSDKGTFSGRGSTRNSSPVPVRVKPPVPPKTSVLQSPNIPLNTRASEVPNFEFPFPPPPEELLVLTAPPMPPKPATRSPLRPEREKRIPDPIYAMVNKGKQEMPSASSPNSPTSPTATQSLNNNVETAADRKLLSGIGQTMHKSSQDQLAYLDSILAQLS